MLLIRALSFLAPILVAGIVAYTYYYPLKFYSLSGWSLTAGLVSFLIIYLFHPARKNFYHGILYAYPLLLLTVSSLGMIALFESFLPKLAVLIFLFIGLFYYYDKLFTYLYLRNVLDRQKPVLNFHLIEILSVFYISSALFGLREFLSYRLYQLLPLLFLLLFIMGWSYVALNNYKNRHSVLFISVMALVSMEIFWALVSLPLIYYIKGLIFTALYIVFILVRQNFYTQSVDKKTFKIYIFILAAILLIVLSTARWF